MDLESFFGDDQSCHWYWKVHMFAAGIVGVLGVICIMVGALAPVGIVLLGVSIAWGVTAWAVGMYQCRGSARTTATTNRPTTVG